MPVTNVKSRWNAGKLEFYDEATGTTVVALDGPNLKMSIPNGSSFEALGGVIDKVETVAGTTSAATGSALSNRGTSLISSSAAHAYYTLTKPVAGGYRKEIVSTAGTTGLLIVIKSSGATFDGTNSRATMNKGTTGLCNLKLISTSATRWQILDNVGVVTFTT